MKKKATNMLYSAVYDFQFEGNITDTDKIEKFFLSISINICFGCSKVPSH